MDEKNISISLFRVSSDSKFLDMIIDCPMNYYFTYLEIETRSLNDDGKFFSQWFDLSDALFGDEQSKTKTHWAVRIPLNKLKIDGPAIYIATLKAYFPGVKSENDDVYQVEPDELVDYMICSDVNDAYYYLLDHILDMSDKCFGISEDAIRNYLILYGHQAALQQHDLEIAEMYFKLIINKFDKCGNTYRPTDKHRGSSCNCGRR